MQCTVVSVCLSVCLSACLSVCLSVCLSAVCLSVCLSACLSACLLVWLCDRRCCLCDGHPRLALVRVGHDLLAFLGLELFLHPLQDSPAVLGLFGLGHSGVDVTLRLE